MEHVTESSSSLWPSSQLPNFWPTADGGIGREVGADPVDEWPRLPEDVVKSAGRTLQILEFFDDKRDHATVTEIAQRLNYPQSSTSILLRSLVRMGYLTYNSRRRTFFPTSRVRILGSWMNPPLFGDCRLSSLVNEINSRTGHAAFLAIRNDLHSQYIYTVQATTTLRLHLSPGTRRPIATSVSGKVLLSKMSDDYLARLVRRINAERSRNTAVVDIKELLTEIAEIRRVGYGIAHASKVTPGAAVVATLLPVKHAQSHITLGVGGAKEAILPDIDAIASLMRELTRTLERSWGATSGKNDRPTIDSTGIRSDKNGVMADDSR